MIKGWKKENIANIGPTKPTFKKGWHSIRNHFGISAFGINAVTINEGEEITKLHNEIDGNDKHEEIFFVHKGRAEFEADGQKIMLEEGDFIAFEPHVMRGGIAKASPTTIVMIGSPIGKAYKPPSWDIS